MHDSHMLEVKKESENSKINNSIYCDADSSSKTIFFKSSSKTITTKQIQSGSKDEYIKQERFGLSKQRLAVPSCT